MTSSSRSYDSCESRLASVSSMRNTNRPPWWRANAQLNSAVRAMPTCGLPVGDGQKRATTSLPVAVVHRVSVIGHHRVGQGAQAVDRHGHVVAGLHGSDSLGGAGQD